MRELETETNESLTFGSVLLRSIIAIDFSRFALAFWPRFEGSDGAVGIADKIFNPNHTYGFRVDFLWLIFSTISVACAFLYYLPDFRKNRGAHKCSPKRCVDLWVLRLSWPDLAKWAS